ncbi:MerR family mercuric resistance operon transcriptional regulator [Sphingomonas endophytica]|jgi:MerR family mercuric resistance operon transcriptional regulator|uniref:Mercuric resistance operon regulatory protein n=1 Tax=Sphingomonas endophytica TaxID=869719 RepID=A0A7X0JED5_9SPHN|nr:MerR family DNA-binding protein [Sphingomonas endophytica]MBB6505674.1 MerR family mercuric resistance operon transcriptional regulator [Sphingomonas endophytica]
MASMTIAGLAREGGVGVETVRYYQRRGLLDEPERPAGAGAGGGIRRYDAEDVRRLRFIRSAQAAGFTLEQIGELLALDATDDRARARQLANERIAALDAQIVELQRIRASLDRLAQECGSGAEGPCPILMAFDISDVGQGVKTVRL